MFGKLFAHEFRNSWRIPMILSVVAVVIAAIVGVQIRLLSEDFYGFRYSGLITGLSVLFIVVYVLFMIAANLIVMFLMVARFYKEVYADTGYLTHTLPVTKATIINAHLLNGAAWTMMIWMVDILCFIVAVGSTSFFREDILWELQYFYGSDYLFGTGEAGAIFRMMGLFALISAMLAPFLTMLRGYCAVSLGQIMRKHRIVGAFAMYFLINMVTNFLSQALSMVVMFISNTNAEYYSPEQPLRSILIGEVVFVILAVAEIIVFWVVTKYRMENSLNLE